jgi:hypothetical protein
MQGSSERYYREQLEENAAEIEQAGMTKCALPWGFVRDGTFDLSATLFLEQGGGQQKDDQQRQQPDPMKKPERGGSSEGGGGSQSGAGTAP